ncbi:MAG: DMT family transporter [bacterium]|nr:DMT family transporter [bacterium]
MMNNHTMRFATVLALGAALFSGTNNFLTKIAVTVSSDPIFYTTLKNAIVALLLIGLFIALRKASELKKLTRKQWGMLAAIGLIGGSIPFALFFTGLSMTSAVNAGLIHKTLFLWVLIFAYPFLKERLSNGQLFGIFLIFLGNLFVGGFTGFKLNMGELMILGATLLWAVENIIAKKVLADISSMTVVAARMVLGSLLLAGFLAVSGRLTSLTELSALQWGWTLATSALLLGFVLTWYTALKHAPATYVAALLVPATIVTNVLSAIFVTHTLTWLQVLSAVFCATGAGLLIYFGIRAAKTGLVSPITASQ